MHERTNERIKRTFVRSQSHFYLYDTNTPLWWTTHPRVTRWFTTLRNQRIPFQTIINSSVFFFYSAFFRYHTRLVHQVLRGGHVRHRDPETSSRSDTPRYRRFRRRAATTDSASEDARQVSPISKLVRSLFFRLSICLSVHTSRSFFHSRRVVVCAPCKDTGRSMRKSDLGHTRRLFEISRRPSNARF